MARSAAPVLRLEGVGLTRGEKRLLDDVNLVVHAGEHWALLGPNGAGKTTMLGLCGAHIHPTDGTVRVLGHQLGRVDVRELRSSIGHVNPRHPVSSPLSVLEVILTGATGTNDLVPRWTPSIAERDRAMGFIELLGLGKLEAERWPTLSQGERGRALIARALMPEPRLLLLDEPATGLDVAAREHLLTAVSDLAQANPELATVTVTHHLEELPATPTHAVLLRDGEILAQGSAPSTITTTAVSRCFDFPLTVSYRQGRWSAQAAVR
ncbi:ATP-binding cassette domain-containing protein [Jatrophihabitans sp.]|uniref:ABC transporter ATP-binding protein n=1 Tax=Jatrophihabitans sp. TaxID=1932789 RepID=UPI0030C6B0C8|nr:transporter [Jatrophihabitans sp.]